MAQTTYQVILSTDGKHTVIATTDDQAAAKAAFGWAKATYDRVVEVYGTKADLHKAANGNGHESVPMCGIHHVPMSKVEGKRGPFYSCHEKNPDGSWCNYRADAHLGQMQRGPGLPALSRCLTA